MLIFCKQRMFTLFIKIFALFWISLLIYGGNPVALKEMRARMYLFCVRPRLWPGSGRTSIFSKVSTLRFASDICSWFKIHGDLSLAKVVFIHFFLHSTITSAAIRSPQKDIHLQMYFFCARRAEGTVRGERQFLPPVNRRKKDKIAIFAAGISR